MERPRFKSGASRRKYEKLHFLLLGFPLITDTDQDSFAEYINFGTQVQH